MRSLISAFCLLGLLPCSLGEEELPQVTKMKEVYQSELNRVTKPVKSNYYRALVKLQNQYSSANKLDEALAVKQEIDRLLATNQAAPTLPKAAPKKTPDKPASLTDEPLGARDKELRDWRGDGRIVKDGSQSAIQVAASSQIKELDYTFDVDDYPNGVILKFEYKSDDYEGAGLMLRGFNTPTGSYTNPVAVDADKRWHDVTWVFDRAKYTSPTTNKEAKEIRMVIQVLGGDGDILFKEIELTKM